MTLRIGLTGGIGSGKSTVAAMLVQEGATLIDADAISQQLTAPAGAAIAAITEQFGAEFISSQGGLNRQRMREFAFAHPSAKEKLQAIIHPLVRQEVERQTAQARSSWLVLDIPLLVESKDANYWRGQLHRIIVVDCEVATQIERVMQRPGWTRTTAEQVIATQATRAQRLAAADICLYNDSISLGELANKVQKITAMIRSQNS